MVQCSFCKKDINFLSCCEFHSVKNWQVQEIKTFCSMSCLSSYIQDLKIVPQAQIKELLPQLENYELIVSDLTSLHRREPNSYYKSFLGDAINKVNFVLFELYSKTKQIQEVKQNGK